MSGPGQLNRRLVLEAVSESDDGVGGVTRLYDVVTTLWAQVIPLSARADNAAAGLGAALRATIVIRRRTDITTRHRFIDGTHTYRVIAVRESADRRFLEIDAEERED
ncbi:MAG TPA: phage head closure protein [Rhizomicrobium sp.]